MTRISVVTAVYNRKDTVGEALDSVFCQTHPSIESVVIDGASTDGTRQILETYRDRIDVLVSERDGGIYDALNKGIRHATGDVVGFLHADDVLADPGVLARIAQAFEDPRIDAVYGDLKYVAHGDLGKVIRHWKSGEYRPSMLRNGWMPPHPTFYVRRSVYAQHGGFDVNLRIAADYDSVLRFLTRGRISLAYVPSVLVLMRVGGASNASLRNILRKSREDLLVIRRNQIGGWLTLFLKNTRKIGQFFAR